MADGLYTPSGQFITFEEFKGADLLNEVATAAAVGEMSLGDMVASLPDPDPILLKKGEGVAVLEELTADDQVATAMANRKLRVLNNADYDYKPGVMPGKEATPQAKALVDELTKDLEAVPLRDVFSEILDTPFYGSTFLELFWLAEGGKYRLVDIVGKPREWFVFNKERKPALKPSQSGEPAPLPAGKFLVPRYFPTYKNPYGLRLLSRCLWPVAFKRGGIKFYIRFLEKYGTPWVLGKAPTGAKPAEKEAMAADLARMVQDAVAVVSKGAEVDLVEPKGKAGEQFETYLKRWDKAILKVIMGQTLTAEMDGQGSRAASQTHYEVADDIAEADQFMVMDTMNRLAAIYGQLNAPGVPPPVFEYNEPEDYGSQADLDKKLYGVGVRFTAGHFERRYGLQPDEFTLANTGGMESDQPAETRPTESAEHAESSGGAGTFAGDSAETIPPGQAALDALVKAILPTAAKQNEKFVGELLGLIDKAESFEDIQLLLAEHLGQDKTMEEQQDLLADLMIAASLLGRTTAGENNAA